MPRARISACLIVQDEHERLPAALASVAFCDEVIVVDGGSTDDTVALAREAGAQVIESPWRGFAIQRNVAIDAARGDWILEVDADERVSPALRSSIEALLDRPPQDVGIAVCALRNRFLGGLLGPSAKYPAYRSRLFRRGAYRHDESLAVHEGLELRELPAILEGDLEHELAATLLPPLSEGGPSASRRQARLSHNRGGRLARRLARAVEDLARRELRRAGVDLRVAAPPRRARARRQQRRWQWRWWGALRAPEGRSRADRGRRRARPRHRERHELVERAATTRSRCGVDLRESTTTRPHEAG
jgi:glycosyltransferase involved in cell wall biosynthesis